MQNAFVESFNEWLRGECLSERLFGNLAGARSIIGNWISRAKHERLLHLNDPDHGNGRKYDKSWGQHLIGFGRQK